MSELAGRSPGLLAVGISIDSELHVFILQICFSLANFSGMRCTLPIRFTCRLCAYSTSKHVGHKWHNKLFTCIFTNKRFTVYIYRIVIVIYDAHSEQSLPFYKSQFGDLHHFAIVSSPPPPDATGFHDNSNISTFGPVDMSRSKLADTTY